MSADDEARRKFEKPRCVAEDVVAFVQENFTLDGGEIDPKLLEILVCPVSRGPLTWDREAGELISEKARLAYPIRRGIPVMLEAEARRLDD